MHRIVAGVPNAPPGGGRVLWAWPKRDVLLDLIRQAGDAMPVLKELVAYDFDNDGFRSSADASSALELACVGGSLELVQYLVNTFGLTKKSGSDWTFPMGRAYMEFLEDLEHRNIPGADAQSLGMEAKEAREAFGRSIECVKYVQEHACDTGDRNE